MLAGHLSWMLCVCLSFLNTTDNKFKIENISINTYVITSKLKDVCMYIWKKRTIEIKYINKREKES